MFAEREKAVESNLNAVVTLRNEVSPWLRILQVAPKGWDLPKFAPGQYTTLGLYGSTPRCSLAEAESSPPVPGKLIRRAYSIASSPLVRDFLEFYVNLVPGGVFTPRLFHLKIGDRVWLSQRITGAFTFDRVPEDANVILIANGSGLAPYLSMLTTHLELATQRRVVLVHGVRHSWDLGYRSTLMALQHLRPHFTYLPVISRPGFEPVPWRGATGHVQDVWTNGTLERACGFRPPPDTHIFLCGSPDMIESMTELLEREGFEEQTKNNRGQVHVERYWPKKTGTGPAVPGTLITS
jgi:ferredoxin/flavodoxin---NADP+ reductase